MGDQPISTVTTELFNALAQVPDGANLLLVVRSAVGLTTHLPALCSWLRGLDTVNRLRIRLVFWTMARHEFVVKQGLEFCKEFKPVKFGTAGHSLEVKVSDLVGAMSPSPRR